jgi:hypothetical protein
MIRGSLEEQRDNLLRTVRFNHPDYIPMTFHINDACWEHYPREALLDLMEAHPFLFPDFDRATVPACPAYPPYASSAAPFTDPWGCVWETTMDGLMGVVTHHPLANWDDFAGYEAPDPQVTTHWGPIDWNAAAESMGPAIAQTCIKNGEIGHNHTWLRLIDIRGYENVLFDMADGEPRLRQLLDMLDHFNLGLVRNYIQRVGAQWIGFAEDLGMQHGPMLSPADFRSYIQPSYRRLMQEARDAGCVVHVHADGDVRLLVDDLLDCGVDVLNLQDLVNGIAWIKDHLQGKVCLDLDLDRQDVTVHGSPKDVDELVYREIRELGSPAGGLMMIYGLYPGVPLENAAAVMDAMTKYATFYS